MGISERIVSGFVLDVSGIAQLPYSFCTASYWKSLAARIY